MQINVRKEKKVKVSFKKGPKSPIKTKLNRTLPINTENEDSFPDESVIDPNERLDDECLNCFSKKNKGSKKKAKLPAPPKSEQPVMIVAVLKCEAKP